MTIEFLPRKKNLSFSVKLANKKNLQEIDNFLKGETESDNYNYDFIGKIDNLYKIKKESIEKMTKELGEINLNITSSETKVIQNLEVEEITPIAFNNFNTFFKTNQDDLKKSTTKEEENNKQDNMGDSLLRLDTTKLSQEENKIQENVEKLENAGKSERPKIKTR